MAYDMKCPVCGAVNRGLNLDETEGRMICERCGTETQDVRFRRFVRRPVRRAEMFVRPDGNGKDRKAK